MRDLEVTTSWRRVPFGSFGEALSFLTPIAGPVAVRPAALYSFPIVGALLGGLLGAIWLVGDRLWPHEVAAGIVVLVDLCVTGMLHFDGLADSADGLLGPLSKERRLEVMRDPRTGAFGVAAVGITLLLRWVSLSVIAPSIWLMVAIWTASRTLMALVVIVATYARSSEGGIASAFIDAGAHGGKRSRSRFDTRSTRALLVGAPGVALVALTSVIWAPVAGPVSIVAGVACATWFLVFAMKRLGGYTGDVLGAAGVILETVALVVAAARW